MAVSCAGLGPESDCSGKAKKQLYDYRPILSSERVPNLKKPTTVRQKKENVVMGSRWDSDTKTLVD
jgi:hypothetical protein